MTKARVIFAGGSKRMAHNNEDLFERWQIRVSQTVEQELPLTGVIDSAVREFIPNYGTPSSVQECRTWRIDLIQKDRILARELTLINRESRGLHDTKKRYAERRSVLVEAVKECQSQLRLLKSWLVANSPDELANVTVEVGMKLQAERDRADYWYERARAAEEALASLKSELGVA